MDEAKTFGYARNVAAGLGPVLQPGAEPVEGYSNPTWPAPLAVGARIGLFNSGAIFGVPDYVLFLEGSGHRVRHRDADAVLRHRQGAQPPAAPGDADRGVPAAVAGWMDTGSWAGHPATLRVRRSRGTGHARHPDVGSRGPGDRRPRSRRLRTETHSL
jgi:hypothetical protein